jgi:hypothetical protein
VLRVLLKIPLPALAVLGIDDLDIDTPAERLLAGPAVTGAGTGAAAESSGVAEPAAVAFLCIVGRDRCDEATAAFDPARVHP